MPALPLRSHRRLGVLVAGLLLAGCTGESIRWGDVVYGSRAAAAAAPSLRLPLGDVCPASVRTAAERDALYAAWWSTRPDSSAVLMVARSEDGGAHWSAPEAADRDDRATLGCLRPAPAITVDPSTGYVFVSYFVVTSTGPGIFFAHSMDRGRLFHAPVVVVYGDRPAHTSVAAHGDRVVVAYEDPNAPSGRVGIALSRTMGHLFEERLDVSSESVAAVDPLVALEGDTIRVGWRQGEIGALDSAFHPVTRAGRWVR